MNRKKHGGQNITVGDIANSVGIAIGEGASASVNQSSPPTQEELIGLLDEFIRSLGSYDDTLFNSHSIRESAIAARTEAARPSPRWRVIRRLLKGIAASVSGVATLTDAINNLEALVARIAR